jgi:ribonuclease VapC
MVIDTSAILAWLKDEPARDRIVAGWEAHSVRRMSSVSSLEAQIVVRGRVHPAQLNMGDCAVYALAKTTNEPLLFVGNDFSQTDIEPC